MSIVQSELKNYKSKVVTNTSANGGRMSKNEITSGAKNNIFPDVSQAERTAGVIRYRKVFPKVANDDDLTLSNAKAHLVQPSESDDYYTLFAGTQRGTQGDISSPDEYGAGQLKNDVSAGATQLVAVIENSGLTIFRNGDMIWIGDGTNEEYHDNVTISKNGVDVTITLDSGDQLANGFDNADTVVASVHEIGDVECEIESWNETSSSGTYDEGANPLDMDNIGTIEEDWTLTFTSATDFTVSGDTVGSVGSGSISSDFAPNNPNFSKPYFKLLSAGWGGTWASGDTITFSTHPAAAPLWFKQTVPAGAASATSLFDFRVSGESA